MRLVAIALLVLAACHASPAPQHPEPDTLEMRTYVFVLLVRGPSWTPEKTDASQKLFEGHMANIHAMAEAGKLLIAGPFDAPDTDTTAPAGVFIFDSDKIAEIEPLLAKDPAIAAGRLVAKPMLWYGPAHIRFPGMAKPKP